MTAPVRTTCPYCGVGCGVLARPDGTVAGDPEHPANRGRLCSKGAALGQTLGLDDRLLHPTIGGCETGWDEALDLVATRFQAAIAEHGPDSVAFYLSGQCLTEDYYVANKLMKGFIGSGNIDTNSRLCMASTVAGHTLAFGADIVPGIYEDLDEADLVILVGSNTAWCHPILYQRLVAARSRRGTRIVTIDPRRTATAADSDLHLAVAPGSDVALFDGLLAYLVEQGTLDRGWIERHTEGFETALAAALPSAERVAEITGAPEATLRRFFGWFAGTERVVTLFSQGVNQSSAGTDKVNAIINCHLATGRIGKPGAGPFSLTGQPNAMGGREVGGLANQLAAHMRFEHADLDRVRRFWRAPNLATEPGLKAVDLFDAVADGRIKALWIMATNPADSMPRSGRIRDALAKCPFVVVSDCWPTDTTALAHIVLPAAAWGEKDGTVTNSERRISRQRPFRPAPGHARPDWWMLAEVGSRMGWAQDFAWTSAAQVFREHAALSGFENEGERLFDIGALSGLDDAGYDRLVPVRWPVAANGGEGGRLFGSGGFPTSTGRARFVPTPWRPPAAETGPERPFLLNTGRVRDQWHTMTRTGRVPRLLAHRGEPHAALAPADADRLGIEEGDLVRLTSDHGTALLRASVDRAQRPGEIYVPMHWTDGFCSAGPVAHLVGAAVDPVSGQPELKATALSATRVATAWRGSMLHRRAVRPELAAYWSRRPLGLGHAIELAGTEPLPGAGLPDYARRLLDLPEAVEWLEIADPARGLWRFAALVEGRLEACLFLTSGCSALPAVQALAGLLGTPVDAMQRPGLLGARSGRTDRTICACFAVGLDQLREAVQSQGLNSTEVIGQALRAGTKCGSCLPELRQILRETPVPAF
ncbi:MAG TPA: molybdopterin-dependent oxidoreductase [Aliidongia sp.]|nr:molybdopterin-dependent oxidoreductase [Aliidongia sp.]